MKEIIATITSKGQVTIPREVRRHLGVESVDRISFVVTDVGTVELRPARHTVAGLRGVVPGVTDRETEDFADQIEKAYAEEADRIAGELERA